MVIRYPIFLFYDDRDLIAFSSPDEHRDYLEDAEDIDTLFDSDGRLLTASDAKHEVEISDSGAADPERLRSMLRHVLQLRGQTWGSDASLESLVSAAQELYGYDKIGIPVSEAVGSVLRRLRPKKPRP